MVFVPCAPMRRFQIFWVSIWEGGISGLVQSEIRMKHQSSPWRSDWSVVIVTWNYHVYTQTALGWKRRSISNTWRRYFCSESRRCLLQVCAYANGTLLHSTHAYLPIHVPQIISVTKSRVTSRNLTLQTADLSIIMYGTQKRRKHMWVLGLQPMLLMLAKAILVMLAKEILVNKVTLYYMNTLPNFSKYIY